MKEPGQINTEDILNKIEDIDRRLNDFDAYFRMLMHQKRSDKSTLLIAKLKEVGRMTMGDIENYFGSMQASQAIRMAKRIEKTNFGFKYIPGRQGKEQGLFIYQKSVVAEQMNKNILKLLEANNNEISLGRIMTKLDLFDYKEANILVDNFIKENDKYVRVQDYVIINDHYRIVLLESKLHKGYQ